MQVKILGLSAVWQKYFLAIKLPLREESKLPPNSKIQETELLVSFFYLYGVLHVLTIERYLLHSASDFLCERKSSK